MSKKRKIILGSIIVAILIIIALSSKFSRESRINKNIELLRYNPHDTAVKNLVKIGKPAIEPVIFAITYNPVHTTSGFLNSLPSFVKNNTIRKFSQMSREESLNLKLGGVKVLGEIGNKKAAKALTRMLKEDNEELVKETWKSLTRIGDPAVPMVMSLLKHDDINIRIKAAEVLGEIRNPYAVELLADTFFNDDIEVKSNAVWALEQMGKPTVPYLLKGLEVEDDSVRWRSVKALGRMGDKSAVKPLVAMYYKYQSDKFMKMTISDALKNIPSPEALEVLFYDNYLSFYDLKDYIQKIKEPGTAAALVKIMRNHENYSNDSSYRLIVFLKSINEINDPQAVEALIEAIDDKDEFVSKNAILLLARLGNHRAVVPLLKIFKKRYDEDIGLKIEPHWAVPGDGEYLKNSLPEIYALIKMKDPGKYDIFIKILDNDRSELKPPLVFFLRYLWHEKGCFYLMEKSASPDFRIRYILVKVFASNMDIHKRKVEERSRNLYKIDKTPLLYSSENDLMFLLDDNDYRVRAEAARALGNYRCVYALKYLKKLLKDKNQTVRERAKEAIRKIQEK